ncbi:hypothetical protein AH074_000885 [Salmonella enterica subsp. houtenae]|nr:hypothetical protein [Salmonella enterica subsp. enterica]EAW0937476.1 hypothetical protein [Salmonella enterica]EBF8287299.1 hypothetical protein [Salmonella enterica subsp. houtenae]ECU3286946.1 hypothetical protein [Salmonella enterica subsp. houtenae serovar Houten]EDS4966635.1 hypothetical protein [Salmonella enterica subsp. enterica serovar O rough]EHA4051525.1 hypothetical protein [Salmonella enterica subsp. enterica serovar Farmingdale]
MNTITAETLSPITHNQTPVITTELLAQLYGTEPARIRQGYSRNQSRFIEGKHFFKLMGSALKSFKNEVSLNDFVKIAPTTNHLILWTERGAARHAKMLETDQAWDVFEKLEDCYFSQKDAHPVCKTARKSLPGKITPEQQEAIKQLVMTRGKALPKECQAEAMITMWSSLKSHFGCSYKEISEEQFTEALSIAARVPIEGEFIGRQEALPAPVKKFTDEELYWLVWLWKISDKMSKSAADIYPGLRELNSVYAGRCYDMAYESLYTLRQVREILLRETWHIDTLDERNHNWRHILPQLRQNH